MRRLPALLLATAALTTLTGAGRPDFDGRVLIAHNKERALVGSPALRWNPALAADAAAWAGELAATGAFEHAPDAGGEPQGENLFMGTRGAYGPEAMVDAWAEEKKHYVPGVFPNVSRTGDYADVGHYTQLAWAETGEVGCAVARSGSDDYLVCRYAQAGNVIGERAF